MPCFSSFHLEQIESYVQVLHCSVDGSNLVKLRGGLTSCRLIGTGVAPSQHVGRLNPSPPFLSQRVKEYVLANEITSHLSFYLAHVGEIS